MTRPARVDHGRYFGRGELACPCCGRCGDDDDGVDARLVDVLDAIRAAVGAPVYVSSCYRCEAHNREVGGVPGSWHTHGRAADISTDALTELQLAALAEQAGADGIGVYWGEGWIHVDTRGRYARWSE